MMSFWRQHRRSSRIARAMLVVWCFALGSSWANACLLQDRVSLHEREHQGTARLLAAPAGETPASAADAHGASGHDDADGPRALCQSVCDDGQATVPEVVTPEKPDPGPPGVVRTKPWSFCAVESQIPGGWTQATAPPPEAPVAIRFLRLTT